MFREWNEMKCFLQLVVCCNKRNDYNCICSNVKANSLHIRLIAVSIKTFKFFDAIERNWMIGISSITFHRFILKFDPSSFSLQYCKLILMPNYSAVYVIFFFLIHRTTVLDRYWRRKKNSILRLKNCFSGGRTHTLLQRKKGTESAIVCTVNS